MLDGAGRVHATPAQAPPGTRARHDLDAHLPLGHAPQVDQRDEPAVAAVRLERTAADRHARGPQSPGARLAHADGEPAPAQALPRARGPDRAGSDRDDQRRAGGLRRRRGLLRRSRGGRVVVILVDVLAVGGPGEVHGHLRALERVVALGLARRRAAVGERHDEPERVRSVPGKGACVDGLPLDEAAVVELLRVAGISDVKHRQREDLRERAAVGARRVDDAVEGQHQARRQDPVVGERHLARALVAGLEVRQLEHRPAAQGVDQRHLAVVDLHRGDARAGRPEEDAEQQACGEQDGEQRVRATITQHRRELGDPGAHEHVCWGVEVHRVTGTR